VVFGLPLTRPGDREFLGAYSSPERAQEFVDAQDAAVRANLAVVEVTIDQHPRSDDFWAIPGETR
jgi:hypothetical protein